jgi:hypothetical protein
VEWLPSIAVPVVYTIISILVSALL